MIAGMGTTTSYRSWDSTDTCEPATYSFPNIGTAGDLAIEPPRIVVVYVFSTVKTSTDEQERQEAEDALKAKRGPEVLLRIMLPPTPYRFKVISWQSEPQLETYRMARPPPAKCPVRRAFYCYPPSVGVS